MCGIFSIVALNKSVSFSKDKLRQSIDKALSVIEHRGPDGQGVWVSQEGKASLGHVRLSIIDLASGQQPLVSEGGKVHAVVNGEFYDYESIRKSFIKTGYRFKTESDSEVLLPLYKKYGTSALNYLRGEFAFCLWDEQSEVFFAARDRFGIKPLYYSVNSGYLYVASEIKSLFAAGIEAKWNKNSYATRAFYLGDETLYEGIYQVPPGHFMLVSNGHIRFQKYWDMNFEAENDQKNTISEQEYVESVREKFEESVKHRLRSDVDVGVYLSGGIDSSSVLSVAAKHSSKPLNTFTLCFNENDDFNEQAYAKLTSEHVGVKFNPVQVTEADIADNFSAAIWHNETPFFNGHGIAKYLLSRAVNQHGIKVVLTGEGADEVFGGYPHYQRDMALFSKSSQNNPEFARLKEKILQHEGSLNLPDDVNYPVLGATLGYQPSWMQYQAQWMEALSSLLSKDYAKQVSAYHPYQYFMLTQGMAEQLKGRHPVHQSMYLWAKSYLPNFVLKTLGDRMEMANSLEGRLAFLDHHLVELANKIPASMKVTPNTTKHILREALKPYLPEKIYQRKKHYFRAPQALLTPDGKLYAFIRDVLNSKDFEALPFFDHKKVREFLDKLPALSVMQQSNYDGVLMEMASLSLLQKTFGLAA